LTAGYSYALERGIRYDELLMSVKRVDAPEVVALRQATAVCDDAHVISAIQACITAGVNTKLKLADAASKSANVSNRTALKTIERYTGLDAEKHRWTFAVRARGAKVFVLLKPAVGDEPSIASTVT